MIIIIMMIITIIIIIIIIIIIFEFEFTSCKTEQISAALTETDYPIYFCQFDLKYLTINFTL